MAAAVVTPPEVLQTGSLNGVEAPTGVLQVEIGSFEAAPPGTFGGGTGILGRELPVAVAPKLAAHPPKICLVGTGSLDFQALAAEIAAEVIAIFLGKAVLFE